MVFENIVKELLNRYLGEYVENLDANQLNIGIWGGNVELSNLQLKRDALKDLDLPIEVVYGYLGKLTLKIPWKNLYTEPVEATVDRLFLFAKPTKAVEYDAEKEEKRAVSEKLSKLKIIEESRAAKATVDKLKTDKGFVEKLIIQIVNNIQIRVSEIHIRYEDKTSTCPFAFGVTLKNFNIHTTDADWLQTFVKEAASKTFKIANLDGLAIYFNCSAESFDKYEGKNLLAKFAATIGTEEEQPAGFNYIFGPITSEAKAKLNATPEDDDPPFGLPKIELTVALRRVTLAITRDQYKNIIELTESMDRSIKGAPYRKFRPNVPVKGNAKAWWLFAYNSVSETHIRRRKREWNWDNMALVRHNCRKYEVAYKAKKIAKKPAPETLKICEEMEEKLSLFNLIRIQNMVEMAVSKMELEKPASTGWLSSWFGGDKNKSTCGENQALMAQFGAAMTSDEKAKLFKAIGYQENATPLELPKEFIAISFFFELNLLEIVVRNEYLDLSEAGGSKNDSLTLDDPSRVVLLQLHKVRMHVEQRPSASATNLNVRMKDFSIYGVRQEGKTPTLVKSQFESADEDQLVLDFVTNPLDGSSDQSVKLRTSPLQIVYDGQTILKIIDVFKPPSNLNISEIQDAASIKMANVKERSATGLEYMAGQHARLAIDIVLKPIYAIIPFKGVFAPEKHNSMIVSLGTVKVQSAARSMGKDDVQTLFKEGKKSDEILHNVMDMCYDTFNLHIENVQILFTQPGDNWTAVLLDGAGHFADDMHVLEPTSIEFAAHVCLISDDPRLPKTKLSGRLPYFGVRLSQNRLLDLLALLLSIPKPPADESESQPTLKRRGSSLYQSTTSLATKFLESEKARTNKKREQPNTAGGAQVDEEIQQFTDLTVEFVVEDIFIRLLKSKPIATTQSATPSDVYSTPMEEFASAPGTDGTESDELIVVRVNAIELFVRQRTYDSKINLNLGGLAFQQYYYQTAVAKKIIKIVHTPRYDAGSKDYLLKVEYTNTSRDSPEFTTKMMSVEQLISVEFSLFVLCLHQEALLDMLRLIDDLQRRVGAMMDTGEPRDRIASAGSPVSMAKTSTLLEAITEEAEETEDGTIASAEPKKSRRSHRVVDSVKLKLVSKMEQVSVMVDSNKRPVALLQVDNLGASVVMKSAYTEVTLTLKDILVKDLNSATAYPQILSVIGEAAVNCTLVLYNLDETSAYNSDDIKIELYMGGMKLVFINWFIQSILNFLDHFQAAQQAIASASAAAADATKNSVVNAYEKATRMNLKVKIKAPIIIVPIDSQSTRGICLDLGLIKATNHFTDIPVTQAVQKSAVIDELKLELSDIKLFCVDILNDDKENRDVLYEKTADYIIVPVTFTLHVNRNLSASWYKDRAEIELSAKMQSIVINLHNSDYAMAMEILAKNMTEGASERSIKPSAQPAVAVTTETDAQKSITSSEAKTSRDSVLKRHVSQDQKSTDSNRTKIDSFLKFAFTMDSLIINLFVDDGESSKGLATFGIYVLSLKGNMFANNALTTAIVLHDIQLDDTRPEQANRLTRYMARKTEGTDDEMHKSMIDITCSLKENSTFADVRVSGFDLIISMDFLMKLAGFLQVPSEDKSKVVVQKQQPQLHQQKGPGTQQPAIPAASPDADKQMNITITIEQPDIILMEKLDGESSNALVFNCELKLKLRQEGTQQNIRGSMENFNLHMCEFEPGKRNYTRYYIINPVSVSLNGSTPDDTGLKVAVTISDISISISPLIIELMNRIMAQVTDQNAIADETAQVEAADYSDLWSVQPFNEQDHWFTQIDTALEEQPATEEAQEAVLVKNELCVIEMGSLVVKIETGFGSYTIPMLRLASQLQLNIRNWSSQIAIEGSLKVGMSYYNSTLAMWEPLLEPNEVVMPNGTTKSTPWTLNLGLNIEDNYDELNNESYKTTKIRIRSPETLELTLTKTCFEVIQDLGAAFREALQEQFEPPTVTAPYSVQNDCGFDVVVNLKASSFKLHESHLSHQHRQAGDVTTLVFDSNHSKMEAADVISCTVPAGGSILLDLKESEISREMVANRTEANQIDSSHLVQQAKYLNVQIGEIKKELRIPVYKADKRYFPLFGDTHKEVWGIVSDVKMEAGSIKLTLHGVIQIQNHFATTITMYRKNGDKFEEVHQIPPNSLFNVPLYTIYNEHRDWHFSLQNYKPSVQGILWKDNPSEPEILKSLQCDPQISYEPFYLNVIRTRKELYYELSATVNLRSVEYIFDLRPPVMLRNTLPIPIVLSIANCNVQRDEETDEKLAQLASQDSRNLDRSTTSHNKSKRAMEDFLDCGEKILQPGELIHLPTVKLAHPGSDNYSRIVVRLVQYLEKDWSCTTEIPANPQENSVWTFTAYDTVSEMSFSLGVHYEKKKASLVMSLYCPFWMINKTGLVLSYKLPGESVNVLYHPADYEGPILFSFPGKYFFEKNKTCVRVDSGDWSDKFSLDVAGSSGMITCPSQERKYHIAVHNSLTEYTLTKKITFMPFYVMVNKAPFDIEVQETSRPSDPWTRIDADKVQPLWPKTDLNQMLRARLPDDPTNITPGFRYTDVQITLLRMAKTSPRGGIYVDVGVTEGGVYMTFTGYSPGNAPALIINNTDRQIEFYEKGNVNLRKIGAGEQMLYTWYDPAGDRLLYWYNDHKKEEKAITETDLQRDDIGYFETAEGSDSRVHWVSFLNGLQRIILFTQSQQQALNTQFSKGITKTTQEIELEIFGIGLSMVNNLKPLDILYVGIASTDVIWEEEKKKSSHFKRMKLAESQIVEAKYQEYLVAQVTGGPAHKDYAVDLSGVSVNFDNMQVMKGSKTRTIKRSFFPGLWFQMKTSPFQTQTHAKINRIQIDNQTPDPIFPVILSPVQLPKSIAMSGSEMKPFIEASIVERVIPYSTVKQYKYLKVLIQEFHIKIDMDFLNEIFQMINVEESDDKREKRFEDELALLQEPLDAFVNVQTTQEQNNFYDLLHLGPLKVHVSFSMQQTDENQSLPPLFSTLLSGIGVTLTDVNDVVFRLAYFERDYQFLTQKKLTSEIVAHYSGQALKQLYVLVFGLDVLGNPYGLVVGIKKGVEDLFYEPFQGLIQGPEEFAQGLVLGVRSLFGHTVGGAAGAVSKITGAVGKGLATLTFDKDFQKKRRDHFNRKPTTLQEGIARSGKGLVTGVFDGVTGVFSKPISGAKEDGVGGFFKGLGQGAVGLFTKPTSGIIDFASGTFDTVKRATEMSDDVGRLRPPRFLRTDGVVRPYSRKTAEGNRLLKEVDKAKYATSDSFVHYEKFADPRKILLVTDHRILYCSKHEIMGAWTVDWTYQWNEIQTFEVTEHAVVAIIKDAKKKMFGMSEKNKRMMLVEMEAKRLRLLELLNNLLQSAASAAANQSHQ